MQRSLEDLEKILRSRVCSVCTDRLEDGTCGLEEPEDCALFRLLPQAARAIQSTDSDDIRDYVRAIRDNVCVICRNSLEDGSCETREQVRCALDAYLVLIVGAIEEATGKTFDHVPAGLTAPLVLPSL
ncbi:MAG: hypothetical protein HYX25_07665 [Candidatus Solibacter usitatus]|nr:hypothetical protein [Candidatus Solibacter usitatus]